MARPRSVIPTKPDDPRVQRSIEVLQQAFLDLIEQKPIEQIQVREITERAGVSYPTFFRRFSGKEELLKHIAAEEVRHVMKLGEAAMAKMGREKSSVEFCNYIAAHRKLWKTLLNGGAAAAMREEFMRAARTTTSPRQNPWLPTDLAVPFVTNGIFEILAWWMRQPEDYPVENVIKLFKALIIDNVGRRRRIKLS